MFASLETSITALRLFTLKELAQSTSRYQVLLQALEKNPHRILITTLIASSVADVTTATLATHITESIFSHLNFSSGISFSLGIGVASIAIILFGEILPKKFAKGHSDRIFKSMLWLINILYYVLYPIVTLLIIFSDNLMKRVSGNEPNNSNDWVSSEREIQFLINYIHEKGLMESEKTKMIQNIFELGTTPVKEIMVPTTDIALLEVNTPLKDALNLFSKHQFTRMPVYHERTDNIIGMVHQKDVFVLISKHEDKPLKDIVRPIMFIPESVKVNQLLKEFRQQHMHIAIVLNEHGSVTGLITLEDVLEEIVGDINDEHEPTHEKIIPLQKGGWLVDASFPLEDLEEFLRIEFDTQDSITLGGFLTEYLQHLPKKGERILYSRYFFQVQNASPTRVKQVLIFEESNPKAQDFPSEHQT
jgi:CBS domain containing-hemolysin-like protein